MTHRHRQQCGDGLWEWGLGWAEEGQGGKIGTTVIEQKMSKDYFI